MSDTPVTVESEKKFYCSFIIFKVFQTKLARRPIVKTWAVFLEVIIQNGRQLKGQITLTTLTFMTFDVTMACDISNSTVLFQLRSWTCSKYVFCLIQVVNEGQISKAMSNKCQNIPWTTLLSIVISLWPWRP